MQILDSQPRADCVGITMYVVVDFHQDKIPLLHRMLESADESSCTGFDRGLGKHFITFVFDKTQLVNFTKVRHRMFPRTSHQIQSV